MKRVLSIVLAVLMFLVFLAPSTYAIDKDDSPTGIMASIGGYGTSADVEKSMNLDLNITPKSSQYIEFTTSSIRYNGGQYLYVSASTFTHSIVDNLVLRVFLERWNGSRWITVTYWDSSIKNRDEINFTSPYPVVNGNHYRVRTTHTVQNNGVTETETSLTSYITT